MAETTKSPAEERETFSRGQLARWVITGAIVGLIVISIVTIWAARTVGGTQFVDTSTLVFNALLPLLGTWVGTVIAYYFSRENFEAANKSVSDLVSRVTPDERLRSVPVRTAMVPKASLRAVELAAGESEADVNLESRVLVLLTGPVTRLPVLDDKDVLKAMIHQSMLYKFVTEQSQAAAEAKQVFDLSKLTLKDFMDAPGMRDVVEKSNAFVAANATLADAKVAMDQTPGSQDVFITDSGKRDEPVLGWISNSEIAKRAKV